ncbi:hypothetical protein [uncultured Nostoc sp.]
MKNYEQAAHIWLNFIERDVYEGLRLRKNSYAYAKLAEDILSDKLKTLI